MRGLRQSTVRKKEVMLKTLENSLGIVSVACRKANISRKTHYLWLEKDEEYKRRVLEVKEIAIDYVESSLFAQIKDKNTTATIFYLKSKGKHRGYVETTYNITTPISTNNLSDKTNEELLAIING